MVGEGCSQGLYPGPEDSHPLETPSRFHSRLIPPHGPLRDTCLREALLKHLWKTPLLRPSALPPPQVGRTWTRAAASWFPISTSGTESAPSVPSASGEKQVVQETQPTSCPVPSPPRNPYSSSLLLSPPLPSAAPYPVRHACTPSLKDQAQLMFVERKRECPAQRLQISKACLWGSPDFSLSYLPCPFLFVASESVNCSALASEIIVTMHTFQDVSWS